MRNLIYLFLLFFSINGISQDLNQLVTETQVNGSDSEKIQLIWWIPVEFWELSFQNDQSLTEEGRKEFIETLAPYTIFAVVEGEVSQFGNIDYTPLDSLKGQLVLVDEEKEYQQLDTEKIDKDVQLLLEMMTPLLKNMLGELGENLHFFVYDDIKRKKERIADPKAKGFVQVNFKDEVIKWRTPLGSLLPLKACPTDKELMNGAWEFCPWHGEKLIENK